VIKKFINFITRGIWQSELESSVGGTKRFLIKELQIFILQIRLFYQNDLLSKASSLAYTTLLSLIPALAIVFVFIKIFGGDMIQNKLKPLVLQFLAAGSGEKMTDYLDSFLASATVEAIGGIGFIFLFMAVYSILSSTEKTFNSIWQLKKNRALPDQLKTYLAIVVVTPVLAVIAIWANSYLEAMAAQGLFIWGELAWFIVSDVFPFMVISFLFWLIIMIIPNCRVLPIQALVGSVYGTAMYLISENLFVYYTKTAVSYNVIYGSIAVLPFFMLWIYFMWIILLWSVQVSFVRQNVIKLKNMEQGSAESRTDRIKTALIVTLVIMKNFLENKEKLSITEMSSMLDIPVKDIRNCLDDLEHNGMMTEILRKQDTYIPSVPAGQFSLRKIVASVDRLYSAQTNYLSEAEFPVLKEVFENYLYALKYEDISIEDLLAQNDKMLAERNSGTAKQ